MANSNRLIVLKSQYDAGNITSGIISSASTITGLTTGIEYYAFALSDAASFTPSSAGLDTTKPVITAAAVANASPSVIVLTASEALDQTATLRAQDFAVSGGHIVQSVAFTSANTISVTVSPAIVNAEVIAATYAKPATSTNQIKDPAGNAMDSFLTTSVTNNVNAASSTTATYTYAQASNCISGPIDTARTANRGYLRVPQSLIMFVATGTDMTFFGQSDSTPANAFERSLDNGVTWSTMTYSAGAYTVFSGLPQATRTVLIRVGSAYGRTAYVNTNGNLVSVTGTAPMLLIPRTPPLMVGAKSANYGWSMAEQVIDTTTPNTYVPSTKAIVESTTTAGSGYGMVTFVSNATGIRCVTKSRYVWYSINRASPVRLDTTTVFANNVWRQATITKANTADTVSVWAAGNDNSALPFNDNTYGVYIDDGSITSSNIYRLDQFGDSITNGVGVPTSKGDVDLFAYAAAAGMAGATYGVSGETVPSLNTRLDTLLPLLTIRAGDVALLATGRNSTAFDATTQAAYSSIIDKLLAKGYSKVICRGIYPDGTTGAQFTTANNGIASIVSGKANPNVVFIDVSTGFPLYGTDNGSGTPDGVHPSAAGYDTIEGYMTSRVLTALGL